MEDIKIGRRFFLKSGGAAAAVAGATIIPIRNANAATLPASSGTTTTDSAPLAVSGSIIA